jgi:Protein of unknown function (DUF3180)
MKPTRTVVLVALVVVAGVLSYVLTRLFYADLQSPPTFAPLWLLLLALAEGYTAQLTRGRLTGRVGTKPINPIVVPRLAALAKASSPVGALATGAYAGFLGKVAATAGDAARHDTRTAVAGVVCGLALMMAALLLERVCRVKPPPDEPPVAGH